MNRRIPVQTAEPTAITAPSGEALRLQKRARELIPGGAHTYAKGADQFPVIAPPVIARGAGSHVWDLDDNEYIEYGMGLRAVTLGHAFEPVIEAVKAELPRGVNFTRPAPIEVELAEIFLQVVSSAEMVKFCKDGSDAVDGAVRLARAYTQRDMIALCTDHPFFSTSDWFIGTTGMPAGIPQATRDLTLQFRYNDLASVQALFDEHPGQIACVILEPARIEEPAPGYLENLKTLVHANGALLVFDEMITGFRWHLKGAQHLYAVTPDLSTFGKALANGFSVSALAGRREIMRLGGYDHADERVFLLSTTHGAETHQLAAALATISFYRSNPVVETLYARGEMLKNGLSRAARSHGVADHVEAVSRDCNLMFIARDADRQPSQAFRTLLMQELIKRGVLAPSFVVSYSHSEGDIARTVDAIDAALLVYRRALEDGVENFLDGRAVKPAIRRFV